MRILSLLLVCCLTIVGCTSKPLKVSEHGNKTMLPDQQQIQLANDAVSVLKKYYPPAKTYFGFSHDTSDAFGWQLTNLMRAQGYAVQEFSEAAQITNGGCIPIAYIVDSIRNYDVQRVTLIINGKNTLDRAYSVVDGQARPITYWAKRN